MPTTAKGNYFGFSSTFFSSLHFVPRLFKIKKTFRGLATHTQKKAQLKKKYSKVL